MSGVAELRNLVAASDLPPGLPPLDVTLRLAVVVPDQPEQGFTIEVGPGWVIATTDLAGEVVHDAALAVSAALAAAVLTGRADPGLATQHGTLTGTMAGQSALAFLIEIVAGQGEPHEEDIACAG